MKPGHPRVLSSTACCWGWKGVLQKLPEHKGGRASTHNEHEQWVNTQHTALGLGSL